MDAESGTSRSRCHRAASHGLLDSSWTSPSAGGPRRRSRRVATRNTIASCELLLETATQGIVSVDARGVIVFANRAVEVMFGWAAEELIGQPIERLIPSAFRDGTNAAAAWTSSAHARTGPHFRSKSP